MKAALRPCRRRNVFRNLNFFHPIELGEEYNHVIEIDGYLQNRLTNGKYRFIVFIGC